MSEIKSIDWPALTSNHGFSHSDTPEEAVHELVHLHECVGNEAFNMVDMDQGAVNKVIDCHFKQEAAAIAHEIKVSAITQLVCQTYGQADLRETLTSMLSNVLKSGHGRNVEEFKNDAVLMFFNYVISNDVGSKAKIIMHYIESNFQEME